MHSKSSPLEALERSLELALPAALMLLGVISRKQSYALAVLLENYVPRTCRAPSSTAAAGAIKQKYAQRYRYHGQQRLKRSKYARANAPRGAISLE